LKVAVRGPDADPGPGTGDSSRPRCRARCRAPDRRGDLGKP